MEEFEFQQDAKQALHIASSLAKEFMNDKVYPAHLLRALLHEDAGMAGILEDMGQDYYYLVEWADARVQMLPKASRPVEEPSFDELSLKILAEADSFRIMYNRDKLDVLSLLAASVTPGVGFSFEQLKSFPLRSDTLGEHAGKTGVEGRQVGYPKPGIVPGHTASKSHLQKYGIDKTQLARDGRLGPIVGFNAEVLSIMETLGRKSKANVLIIGEGGVGKTALIDAFTMRLLGSGVPSLLQGARLIELDAGKLVSGANYKGEIEDRFKKLLDELATLDKAILVIESLDALADPHQLSHGVISVLKQALKKGNSCVIATTSVAGYTKHIETDHSLSRGFEVLKIDEPDEEQSLRIISQIREGYEQHHGVRLDEAVIAEAIRLSKRYLTERCLPDSALDLIDRTMSLVNTMNEISGGEVGLLTEKLNVLSSASFKPEQLSKELTFLYREIGQRISHNLMALVEGEQSIEDLPDRDQKIRHLTSILQSLKTLSEKKQEALEPADVSLVVARLTGIPVGKLKTSERDRLINAADILKQRVVGQDHAIKTIVEAIYESRSGLTKKGQPMGSFFFLGPTGTGKTELAKALADFLFQDESSMIRFDMSEFKEEHSAALLYGAPPGYVGYEEGGLLVNKIRQRPYAVVLFDEIEKAHPSVFDIFLQILDEGKLHDRLGREGNFGNALILFTSNIGSEHIHQAFRNNSIPPSTELMEIMASYFRPEFLGRLTEIVPFAPISESIVDLIFDIHLGSLYKTLDEMDIHLTIDPAAKKRLGKEGFSEKYGARPVIGVIRQQIRRPLSRLIIAGEVKKGSNVSLQMKKNEYKWTF